VTTPVTNDDLRVIALDGSFEGTREVLGGKALSVNNMRRLGLQVPPAFALPTGLCAVYHDNGRSLPDHVWAEVVEQLRRLEAETGRSFGSGPSPLLISVRSGAAQSMPGMMDTVLNLGLNKSLVEVLAQETGDPAWAEETWHRFQECYASTVAREADAVPPEDPYDQLRNAIGAVFDSWTNDRVRAYRTRHQLGVGGGTAVTVQAMVFGNRDDDSATGVMFSRDPATGENILFGEWLPRAQGEDVVSGAVTPRALATLEEYNPDLYEQLQQVAILLESTYRDLVDVEFTIESGRLYILQCRAGKRSAAAAVRIAVDLVREGMISRDEALPRVTAEHVEAVRGGVSGALHGEVLAEGLGAGPGVISGEAVTTEARAEELAGTGTPFILLRPSTAPEDVPIMFESAGVLTESGGSTSHAALVCREIGLPCVVGAGPGLVESLQGLTITIDGTTGKVYAGEVHSAADAAEHPHLAELLEHARAAGPVGAHLLVEQDAASSTTAGV
jgi:pyruvate,orthophosphate dikinase